MKKMIETKLKIIELNNKIRNCETWTESQKLKEEKRELLRGDK
jgi:hypothetical protein